MVLGMEKIATTENGNSDEKEKTDTVMVPMTTIDLSDVHVRRVSILDTSAVKGAAFIGRKSLYGDITTETPRINLQWKRVTVTESRGKKILDNVSGNASAGELMAIMGPSGAGKTTLLNVLSGFSKQKMIGDILVNGEPRDKRTFRKISSYIMQDNYLHAYLTVQESIKFAASLKIAASKESKEQAVKDCIEFLGLSGSKDTLACHLSGGERKRLSIAVEVISNPPVMFLDEPTSGLDSSSCIQCMKLLKALATEGRTVICTIHQPNSKILEAFDKLYMLADGACIYRGTIADLIPFLRSQGMPCPPHKNPSDILMEIAIEEGGALNQKLKVAINLVEAEKSDSSSSSGVSTLQSQEDLAVNVQSSTDALVEFQEKARLQNNMYSGYSSSSFQQFKLLMRRNLICTRREPVMTQARLAAHIGLALILGGLYYGTGNDASSAVHICALLFFSMTFYMCTAAMPAVLSLPTERLIISWEHMNTWYSLKMYFLSKVIIETVLQIMLVLIYSSITYWMTGQPNDLWRFGYFLLSFTFLCLDTQAIMMLVGIFCSVENAPFISVIVTIPFLLFSGFFITLDKTPYYLRWLTYSSFMQYNFHSIMHTIFGMGREKLSCEKGICFFRNPKDILRLAGIDGGDMYVDFAVLTGYLIVFRIAAYFLLKYRVTRN